jgi:hypothetical protein
MIACFTSIWDGAAWSGGEAGVDAPATVGRAFVVLVLAAAEGGECGLGRWLSAIVMTTPTITNPAMTSIPAPCLGVPRERDLLAGFGISEFC